MGLVEPSVFYDDVSVTVLCDRQSTLELRHSAHETGGCSVVVFSSASDANGEVACSST